MPLFGLKIGLMETPFWVFWWCGGTPMWDWWSVIVIYLFIWFLQVERFEFCNGIEEEEEGGRKEGFWVIFNSCNGRPREESHGVWQWKEENGCLTSLKKCSFLVVALRKFHQHRLPEMVFLFFIFHIWILLVFINNLIFESFYKLIE